MGSSDHLTWSRKIWEESIQALAEMQEWILTTTVVTVTDTTTTPWEATNTTLMLETQSNAQAVSPQPTSTHPLKESWISTTLLKETTTALTISTIERLRIFAVKGKASQSINK